MPFVFESRFARNDRGGLDVIVPPLKAQSGRSGKGDGAPLVLSVTERTREGGRNLEWQEDLAYALDNPGGGERAQTRLVAVPLRSRQASEGVSMPGRGGEDDENLVWFQARASAGIGMNPTVLSPTLDVGKVGGMAVAGGLGVRRLTPTECERLQGFPDGWTSGFSDSVRYRMLGNAVCVPVAEWIGRRVLENI